MGIFTILSEKKCVNSFQGDLDKRLYKVDT